MAKEKVIKRGYYGVVKAVGEMITEFLKEEMTAEEFSDLVNTAISMLIMIDKGMEAEGEEVKPIGKGKIMVKEKEA